jgi:hypothetical protein
MPARVPSQKALAAGDRTGRLTLNEDACWVESLKNYHLRLLPRAGLSLAIETDSTLPSTSFW